MKSWYVVLLSGLLAAILFTSGFASPLPVEGAPHAAPAQAGDGVALDSAAPVTQIVGEKNAYLATVSPDGQYIAYGKQSGKRRDRVLQLCVYEYEKATKQCYDLSPDDFNGYPYQFQWSPDSRYIAFSENPVQLGSESDIWLFDRESGAFSNLTDDGLVGAWSQFVGDSQPPMLDYLPMWHPSDGQIYFWRIAPLGNMRFTIGLYRIAPAGGDPEQVRDLTASFAAQAPLFDYEALFLDGVSAIAPAGDTVAALMSSVNDMGSYQQSLWLIDISGDDAAPQQLAGPDQFATAVPEWVYYPPQAQGLIWTGDSAGIVVVANTSAGTMMPFQVYYYVDAASAEVTPLVDFSGLEEMDSYSDPAPGSDLPWRAYSPWTGSLSPQGDTLLMINDLGGTIALFSAPLPPTGDLPVVTASDDESPMNGSANASRGEGGKVIMYGLGLNISEP